MCVFCTIANDDPHGQIEWHYDHSVQITPLNPVVEGHKLFIPYEHVDSAVESPVIFGQVMRDAALYVRDTEVGDCNIITSVGPAATQTVFHLHVHVVPRREGDGLTLPWTGQF